MNPTDPRFSNKTLQGFSTETSQSKKLSEILGIKPAPSAHELELFARISRYVRFVSWIPGLRLIAVSGSLSMYAANAESDIDLFVVTAPGRMWLVRVLMTAIFQILGVRRHGNQVAGRFCLSFFCTTEALDLEKIAIADDAYLEAWIHYLRPIVNIGGTYENFCDRNSDWRRLILGYTEEAKRFLLMDQPIDKSTRKQWFGWLWNILDRTFHTLFEPKTLREFESLGKPWGVRITQDMLKFHPKDAREEVKRKWQS